MSGWRERLLVLSLFTVAMAYVESAVVVYLRQVYGITDLLRDTPVRPDWLTPIELGREIATLVMLFTAGSLAGRTPAARWGLFLYAWGLWDILYYAWLRVFIGWPVSLGDWDLLFLIPLPWWGPVWAPMLAAALMMGVGARMARRSEEGRSIRLDRLSIGAGGARDADRPLHGDGSRAACAPRRAGCGRPGAPGGVPVVVILAGMGAGGLRRLADRSGSAGRPCSIMSEEKPRRRLSLEGFCGRPP